MEVDFDKNVTKQFNILQLPLLAQRHLKALRHVKLLAITCSYLICLVLQTIKLIFPYCFVQIVTSIMHCQPSLHSLSLVRHGMST